MKTKILIIIDAQIDFVTGALGTQEAKDTVSKIKKFAKKFDGKILMTQDTHDDRTYLSTQEGIRLPVKHCIIGTEGWEIVPELRGIKADKVYTKNTFGCRGLAEELSGFTHGAGEDLTIYLCGFCTDICVVSNALLLKAFLPEANINVMENLCAGTTRENHEAALRTIRNNQIDIMTTELPWI